VVLEILDGSVRSSSLRGRATDSCGNHDRFVDLFAGCQAVICGGIGQGAAHALTANGVEPVVVEGTLSVDDAVKGWVAGTLKTTAVRVCLCH
jgi:predicted Fe-Mo cluster-binding NifX family protein